MIEGFVSGISSVMLPLNLLLLAAGVALGLLVGALPGLTSPMAITVLLPITYPLETEPALMLLMGVYVGTKLGGSYAAILLRTPGTPSAACTAMDGFPMAERGEAGNALGYATIGSTFGGIFGWIIAFAGVPVLASVAVESSNADIALIGILGLLMVSAFTRGSMLKGVIGVLLGLLIASIGLDPMDATNRYTFGTTALMEGIPFTAALIGFFGVAVVLSDMRMVGRTTQLMVDSVSLALPKIRDVARRWQAIVIGGLYGTIVGAIPGVGAESATWMAYATAKNRSKHGDRFGTGEPDGILTPEASNNALTGGTMVPMLTLGLPGDGSTAVMLGALVLHGVEPGVLLMQTSGDLVYTLLVSLLIATLLMFFIALGMMKYFILVLKRDRSFLFPFVLVLAVVGAFADTNSVFTVYVAIFFGVVGYVLESRGFPLVTVVLGVILGPIIEYNARVALALSGNDWGTFAATWPRVGMLAAIVIVIGYEIAKGISAKRSGEPSITPTGSS